MKHVSSESSSRGSAPLTHESCMKVPGHVYGKCVIDVIVIVTAHAPHG
jgi:hypothetical protein